MPSDRAPLIPPVGSGVTGALVSIETCATLMVAPPRLTTGPSYVPGVNAVNAHSPGMVPDNASDPSVDQNLVSGTGPVHSNSSDMGSADNTPSMNNFRPPCHSRASAQAFAGWISCSLFFFFALDIPFCFIATSSRPSILSKRRLTRTHRVHCQFLCSSAVLTARRRLVQHVFRFLTSLMLLALLVDGWMH